MLFIICFHFLTLLPDLTYSSNSTLVLNREKLVLLQLFRPVFCHFILLACTLRTML